MFAYLQQAKHEVIKKHNRNIRTPGKKRGESHGKQGIKNLSKLGAFCWLRPLAVCVSSQMLSDKSSIMKKPSTC